MTEMFRADIDDVLSDTNIPWNALHGGTVLVTGATGLIGSALAAVLSYANKHFALGLRILCYGRNADKGNALVQTLGVEFIAGDIRSPMALNGTIGTLDYIIHCAAITKSADMVAKPVEVMMTAVDGTRNMLELARTRQCKSFVYLSSMEVYGITTCREVRESDLGYIDLANPRSSYPESKRLCEALCVAYATQYGLDVKTVRLAQAFGAGTPQDDTRVFAQFARSALAGHSLTLHTAGQSRGNYCYLSDAVRGLLTVLLKGEKGEAYNIANPAASKTVREMAEIVANEVCEGRIKVVVNIPADIKERGYAPDVGYVLNADKLKALGWTPKYGLYEMYARMLADWQNGEMD